MPPAAARILLLVGGLQEMHVHRHAVFLGAVLQHPERPVRAPVQVGRRQLDAQPVAVAVLAVQALEEREIVLERDRLRLQVRGDPVAQLGGSRLTKSSSAS